MDALSGKNSTGRRVSLLNDGPGPPIVRLSSFTPSLPSRTSSYTSSPVGSPPTPRLLRSDSSDSTAMQTPSPITPDFVFDGLSAPGLISPGFAPAGFFVPQQHKDVFSVYTPPPLLPPSSLYTPTGASCLRPPHHHHLAELAPAPAAAAAVEPSQVRPKKNSYPCPLAAQFNCTDYFTTSGHAARHAKKHTGKKDAFCPECNKAFTRKDNMEQHRRTHQTGRNSVKVGAAAAATVDRDMRKTRPSLKRPRPAPLQSSIASLSSLSVLDPGLAMTEPASFLPSSLPAAEPFLDFTHRSPYPDPAGFSLANGYSHSLSYGGLDALAMAASGEKRKFEP